MTISTSCPGCGTKYTLNDAMAGKKAKCKKCGAILTIPTPDAPVLAELADLSGTSPLDGLTDRDFGGDPLGASPSGPARVPRGAALRRPASPSESGGIPKIVWIACGAGGGVCLLLLILILVFGGSSEESAPTAADASGAAASGTPSPGGPATTTPSPAVAPASRKTTVAAAVNDSMPWQWQPERLSGGPSGILAKPLRLTDRLQAAHFTRPDTAQAVLVFDRSSGPRDVLVQRLDLKTGQVMGEHSFPQHTKPLDSSLDGVGLLLYPGDSYAAQETLQLWRWAGKGMEQVAQWKPYEGQSSKRIAWALLLDSARVLTYRASDPDAIAWDAAKGTEVYRVTHASTQPLLLSPGASIWCSIPGCGCGSFRRRTAVTQARWGRCRRTS